MNLNFGNYIYEIPAIILAMTLHEIVKALVSTKLGDNVPRARGRLTLNPFKHIEIIGFALMLLFGYGWSLPVETNPMMYKDRKRGVIMTHVTPSLVNIIVGIAFMFAALAMELTALADPSAQLFPVYVVIIRFCACAARYNVALAVFNVIPVYPLDGYWVLGLFLSPNARVKMSNYEKILQVVMVVLLVMGLLQLVLNPICAAIIRL